ncbi:MAG: DUF4351 domain-containing protein, partial [Thiobacillaceae bacterium]|nr:DUF4351 domain-containing protein [Thiobacillaceae bacterium]
VLRRLMPAQAIPEVEQLQEVEAMLAETVEEWTEQWKQQGLQQGLQQGEALVLERLLARRFGPLSEETRARLQAASREELERWAENILDALTLEEVFRRP